MRRSRIPAINLAIFLSCQSLLLAAPPPTATTSITPFAPSEDLLKQVDYYIERMDAVLAEPAAFDLAGKSRVVKDANTLAALALVLSLYDEEFPQRPAMPTMLEGARRLANAQGDYDTASAALARIKRARAGMADADLAAKWESVASLSVLMKQVPVIHARLTRGVDRRRLAPNRKSPRENRRRWQRLRRPRSSIPVTPRLQPRQNSGGNIAVKCGTRRAR